MDVGVRSRYKHSTRERYWQLTRYMAEGEYVSRSEPRQPSEIDEMRRRARVSYPEKEASSSRDTSKRHRSDDDGCSRPVLAQAHQVKSTDSRARTWRHREGRQHAFRANWWTIRNCGVPKVGVRLPVTLLIIIRSRRSISGVAIARRIEVITTRPWTTDTKVCSGITFAILAVEILVPSMIPNRVRSNRNGNPGTR